MVGATWPSVAPIVHCVNKFVLLVSSGVDNTPLCVCSHLNHKLLFDLSYVYTPTLCDLMLTLIQAPGPKSAKASFSCFPAFGDDVDTWISSKLTGSSKAGFYHIVRVYEVRETAPTLLQSYYKDSLIFILTVTIWSGHKNLYGLTVFVLL